MLPNSYLKELPRGSLLMLKASEVNVMLGMEAMKLFIMKRSQGEGIGDQDQILKCNRY